MKVILTKLLQLALMLTVFTTGLLAQQGVVIGSNSANPTPAPDANAVLWLIGDGTQGLIVPTVSNTSAVATPSKGMVVYNLNDNTLYYYNGNWTAVGSGTGGSSTALLKISGNTVSIDPAGTASIGLANTAPIAGTSGQLMQWDGTNWTSSSSVAPTAGQYLKWNSAISRWEPAAAPAASGLTNPMTNQNEMIIGGAGGNPAKLNAPSANQVLAVGGSNAPTWSSSLSLSGSITSTNSITGSNFIGNGNQLTSLDAGKITAGTLSTANGGTGVSTTSANFFFGGPVASAGTPSFRGLTATDIPALNMSQITTGTLPIAQGGTGGSTTSANFVFAGPAASAGAPSFRALTAADIPALTISKVSSGTLPVTQGGTGVTTLPFAGQLLVGNGAGYTLTTLNSAGGIAIANAAGSITIGTSGNFGSQNLTTTGTLTSANATVNGDATHTGFTQLGASSPGIQLVELTGTTSAVVDGTASVALPVDQSKIVFVNVYVLDASSELIPPMYLRTGFQTYSFSYFVFGTTLTVVNLDTLPFGSSSIRNRPIRVTLCYKP